MSAGKLTVCSLAGLLSSDWREVWLVLYSDSLLAWYTSDHRTTSSSSSPLGGIKVSQSPDLLAAGQYSARVPGRPGLPSQVRLEQVIAVGRRPGNKVHWFVTRSQQEVQEWMSAIVSTLPPPPQQQYGPPPPPPPASQPGMRPPPPTPPAGGKTQ